MQAYDLARVACDGVCVPRYAHHAGRAAGALLLTWAISKAFGLSPLKSAVIATIAVGVLPHVAALPFKGSDVYPLNWPDWGADAVIASAPLAIAPAIDSAKVHKRRMAAHLMAYGVFYVIVSPYASP